VSARLFVALDVGGADRAALAGWAAEAVGEDPGLRLVEPGSIHMTLAFLGHRALDEIEPVAEVVRGLTAPELALRTAGALWLSPRRPHVLTVAVADEGGGLEGLHDELWTGLEAELGVERERRRFRAHLTVARVRRGWPAPSRRLPELAGRELSPEAVVLYRSHLGRGPARYEALERLTLR
jgi:2'-5' RNA ligase